MALHKTNIYIDISGWAPRYIPAEVMRDMKGRLQNQFVFGSDYPFIQPRALPGRAGDAGDPGGRASEGAGRQRQEAARPVVAANQPRGGVRVDDNRSSRQEVEWQRHELLS